ncbi:MAG: phosphate acyltransferase PlsX [Clostridia bacterium]|nr:phosphate acyltransferase PlsX [Clostridia bacterium]
MKILIDAFGGDNSPLEVIKGAVDYVAEGGKYEVCLVGLEDIINKTIDKNGLSRKNLSVLNATEVISCEESPTEAFRKKPNSSICVGLDALKLEDYGAFVSAGSTGALLTAAVFKSGRIKGVSRPALATLLPNVKGGVTMFLDCGANADCKPQNLIHFAVMADVYMKTVGGVKNPKIGLLSNGTEDKKGNELIHAVNPALKSIKSINFLGNIEGRDILSGDYDIVVTDGFSGNIALKSLEGAIMSLLTVMKANIKASLKASLGYKFFMKKAFKKTVKALDYNSQGGAVFLGVKGVVVKSHGSSKAIAFKNSLFQAEEAISYNINSEIEKRLSESEIMDIKFE